MKKYPRLLRKHSDLNYKSSKILEQVIEKGWEITHTSFDEILLQKVQ